MKKIFFLLVLMGYAALGYAGTDYASLLNKVTLQFSAEGFITTKTALVHVGVNAAVSDKGIERIQSDVMQQLNRLDHDAEWHIISYQRQQDSSGLERVRIVAQARLAQSALVMLRTKAKSISKPGEKYNIDSVQFIPSALERRQFNTSLRENIYQQIQQELDKLNKQYPDQKFYIHQINFISDNERMPAPRTMMLSAKVTSNVMTSEPDVGGTSKMDATVVLVSMPAVLKKQLGS